METGQKNYKLKVILSSEADEKFIEDFCLVCNAAFGEGAMTSELFKKKYTDNIYGDSVLCVAYSEENTPAGARALWRNDIAGVCAYQPCDTCVLKEHRRQGLFEKMTFAALDRTIEGAVIYNYPNDNSRRLYLKLGWTIYAELRPRLWKGNKVYLSEHPEEMSKAYYDWWIKNESDSRNKVRKISGSYYLVRDYGRLFQIVVAKIPESISLTLDKADKKLLLYWSDKKCIYNKKRESRFIVKKGDADVKIPSWKMDVI